jgi:molecular chaperone IbpA
MSSCLIKEKNMTNLTLRSFDIPTITKFGIGFERMFDELSRFNEISQQTNYPPYNVIEINDDKYVIELAVAGFKEGEIEITLNNRNLIVKSNRQTATVEGEETKYIHHGISARAFMRSWPIAEYVEVTSATQENGILSITLERKVPEEKKPKTIAITYYK